MLLRLKPEAVTSEKRNLGENSIEISVLIFGDQCLYGKQSVYDSMSLE